MRSATERGVYRIHEYGYGTKIGIDGKSQIAVILTPENLLVLITYIVLCRIDFMGRRISLERAARYV